MSAERYSYLDSSAIVKLVKVEPESAALRRFLHRHRALVSSALARTEVGRALLPFGEGAVRRGFEVLASIELVRISSSLLDAAARLEPHHLRSLDAIHLATAQRLGADVARVVTYDDQMSAAAAGMGWTVVAPAT